MGMQIAIDGPAGAGKSTVAKIIAKKLGYIYVDTGAMYRAIALHLIRQGISADDVDKISAECDKIDVALGYEYGEQVVYLNNENVNGLIRTQEVGNMASASSVIPAVREKLLSLQQDMAKMYDVVMDGRDIGTCILPDAQVKVYLAASVKERARRRFKQLSKNGTPCDLHKIEQEIKERDHRDMTREISPLKKADDAVLIDSTIMTIDEVVDAIIALV